MNPGVNKRFLVSPRKLKHIAESGDMNRTFDPIGPNSFSNSRGDFGNVDTIGDIAVLEIPPDGNPNIARLLLLTPPVRLMMRRSRRRS